MAAALHAQVGTTLALAALALLTTGCQEKTTPNPAAGPRPVARPATGAPEQIIADILQRCHGMLQGADAMANAYVKLGTRADDPSPQHITISADGGMRIIHPNKQVDICLPHGAWRITPGEDAKKHDAEAVARLRRFESMIRAALLAPLYGAKKITRQGPNIFALVQDGGATWRLELKSVVLPDGKAVLLPSTLLEGTQSLEFRTYLHTGITNLPKRVGLGEFGERWYSLIGSDYVFTDRWFTDPLDPKNRTPSANVVRVTGTPVVPPNGKPLLTKMAASTSLIFEDPGDWDGRMAALAAHGAGELAKQGQQTADLDFMFAEGGKRYMAMPFRMFSMPFVQRPTQRILRLPDQDVVVLYTEPGRLEDCEKAAAKILAEFVASKSLKTVGPLRIRPYIEARRPEEIQVDALRVRFEFPVQPR